MSVHIRKQTPDIVYQSHLHRTMEQDDMSDNGEQAIPDIIISRSSIPEAERARNIRMMPVLEGHEEESETDSSKESGADDDNIDNNTENLRQETRLLSGNNTDITETKTDQEDNVQAPQSSTQQDTLTHSSTKENFSLSALNVEEFLSEYEDATEDEQVLVEDQTQQFKVDTAAFEHLDSTTIQQDNTDTFGES